MRLLHGSFLSSRIFYLQLLCHPLYTLLSHCFKHKHSLKALKHHILQAFPSSSSRQVSQAFIVSFFSKLKIMAFAVAFSSSTMATRPQYSSVPMVSHNRKALVTSSRRQMIKCMAIEENNSNKTEGEIKPSTSAVPPPPPPSPPKVESNQRKKRGFREIMAFAGPGPETINGRLAMLGFVSAVAVELFSGKGVLEQISGGGLTWFIVSAQLFTVASLIPLFSGSSTSKGGLMSSNAEMWNGRLAMLGLVALALTEYAKGGPLV